MPERSMDADAMRRFDAGAAIFGMRKRNQVVDHEYRANSAPFHGRVIARILHAVVTGMKQDAGHLAEAGAAGACT